jgi:hypothetical protein
MNTKIKYNYSSALKNSPAGSILVRISRPLAFFSLRVLSASDFCSLL